MIQNKNIYFYIPGGESLNLLLKLYEKYDQSLIIITSSKSVIEICELLTIRKYELAFVIRNLAEKNSFFIFRIRKLRIVINKILEIFNLISEFRLARKISNSMIPGGVFYYSTFFYDSFGIFLFYYVSQKKEIIVKLLWPSRVRSLGLLKIPFLSNSFLFNCFFRNLFAFHNHPTGGRVMGLNPAFILKNNISFDETFKEGEDQISEEIKLRALEKCKIVFKDTEKNILFIGDYSVEHGINEFGKVYLDSLEVLENLLLSYKVNLFFKPHPNYQSINHKVLTSFRIIETQLPVEFLNSEKWSCVVGFASAAFAEFKNANTISLLKVEGIKTSIHNIPELVNWTKEICPSVSFPVSIGSFRDLVSGKLL